MGKRPFRPVTAVSPDGEEIRYPSVKAAADGVGVKSCRISTACVLGHRCAGYHWRYTGGCMESGGHR